MNFEDESIIEASGFKIQPEYELFKRLFDIIVSLILLILASPFMLITAILVKTTSLDQLFINKYVLRKIKRNFQSINFVP
ncbi:sugar transferase [Enterococcus lactis]|nr:sugar transferase [Enterococcus lactis]